MCPPFYTLARSHSTNLVSAPLPQSLRTEVPSSNQGCGKPCVINSASLETVQRVNPLSQTAWLSVFIDRLKPQLWHMNQRTCRQLRYGQFYSASDRPSRKRWADQPSIQSDVKRQG